jgi:hypothetical protein
MIQLMPTKMVIFTDWLCHSHQPQPSLIQGRTYGSQTFSLRKTAQLALLWEAFHGAIDGGLTSCLTGWQHMLPKPVLALHSPQAPTRVRLALLGSKRLLSSFSDLSKPITTCCPILPSNLHHGSR